MARRGKQSEPARDAKARRVVRWVAAVVLLAAVAIGASLLWDRDAAAPEVPEAPEESVSSKLAGRWMRPDGGYVLELSEVAPDGRLTAAYYNPRPINVARASWKHVEGRQRVFVELQDANYEGSTYTLVHDPASDRLAGIYFQAAMRQSFEVVFERMR